MIRNALIASVLLGGATGTAGAAQDALTKKGANPNQIICKVERFVGSNLKNRVCKTRAEWANVADDTKQGMDDRWYKEKYGLPKNTQFRPTPGVASPAGGAGPVQ